METPDPPTGLADFAKAVERQTVEDFAKRNDHPFLLVMEGHGHGPVSAFLTDRVDVGAGQAEGSGAGAEKAAGSVFPVRKTGRNAFQHMVSVGRATNNDIVLNHPAVSKLHAFFRAETDGSGFTLTDSGSTGGTQVGHRLLMPNKSEPVKDGQSVVFGGAVRTTFFSARGLFEHVQSLRFFKKL
jgi:hypothetical protein